AMHKLIVMSATYRQSSKARPELLQRDPYNRLLARGPHVRLEAEQIRDQALAASGLLSHKLGGPSVMPPQPDGLWQMVYSDDKRATYAFRLCLGRMPTSAEVKRLLTVLNTERENFTTDASAAKALANLNSKSTDDPVQLAAWTVVGNVLLNLDETVTKN